MLWSEMKELLEVANRTDILTDPVILDLGGGKGELAKYLNSTDSAQCVSMEMKKVPANPEASQIRADAYQMPFADESFNIIYSRGALDTSLYPHDFKKLLPEMVRVLQKKGVFCTWEAGEISREDLEQYFKFVGGDASTLSLWEKISE